MGNECAVSACEGLPETFLQGEYREVLERPPAHRWQALQRFGNFHDIYP